MSVQPSPVSLEMKQGIGAPPPLRPAARPADAVSRAIADGAAANFWQHPFAQKVLPFITSLVLHASLIVVGILTLKAAREIMADASDKDAPVLKEQVTPVESDMSQFTDKPQANLAGFLGLDNDPTRRAEQNKFPDVPADSQGMAARPGTNLIPEMGGDAGNADLSGIIGIGGAGGLRPGGGVGRGGAGEGDGTGILARFGPGGGGVSFIGSRDVARQVCYVCDASGSMMAMFDDLRMQIAMSVGKLTPAQSFNVIFFQDEGYGALEKSSLLPAIAENKRKAEEFLSKVIARRTTNPIPALELAAKLKPELIYLFTDGDFDNPSNEEVIKYCKDKFSDGKTKINTIAFINSAVKDDPRDLGFVKTLQTIAKNSGGVFRRVSDEDMAQR